MTSILSFQSSDQRSKEGDDDDSLLVKSECAAQQTNHRDIAHSTIGKHRWRFQFGIWHEHHLNPGTGLHDDSSLLQALAESEEDRKSGQEACKK